MLASEFWISKTFNKTLTFLSKTIFIKKILHTGDKPQKKGEKPQKAADTQAQAF